MKPSAIFLISSLREAGGKNENGKKWRKEKLGVGGGRLRRKQKAIPITFLALHRGWW